MLRSTAEMVVQLRDSFGDVPPALMGASTTILGTRLFLFGGRTRRSLGAPVVSVDLYALDIELCRWEKLAHSSSSRGAFPVKARCFHTADIWNNHLVVFGGLSALNSESNPGAGTERLQPLNDVALLDLDKFEWLPPTSSPSSTSAPVPKPPPIPPARHNHISCVSSSTDELFIFGGTDAWGAPLADLCVYDLTKRSWVRAQRYACALDGERAFLAGMKWQVCFDGNGGGDDGDVSEPPPLPYSQLASSGDIYLFESRTPSIDILTPLPSSGGIKAVPLCIGGRAIDWPTGLHRPSGGVLGTTLVVAGTAVSTGRTGVWALDLIANAWNRVDIDTNGLGKNSGMWGAAHVYSSRNKLLLVGAGSKPATNDADMDSLSASASQTYTTHAIIDLEALGIYQPPARSFDPSHQQRALTILASGRHADFAFVCEDGRAIPCARVLVAGRWPWLHDQLELLRPITSALSPTSATPDSLRATGKQTRITATALLQYFYSLALGTRLQRAPPVLSQLLVIATEFRIEYLQALVQHAMHLALDREVGLCGNGDGGIARGVYEVAASCGCRSLQIRTRKVAFRRRSTRSVYDP
ncbi:hypothetical protein MKEN_00534900 [Mycena kentingensis (nom. inval.)]|nr:hypothetical protein MKEN_00534900 [Mycena kentingensis (nom. inval.)]